MFIRILASKTFPHRCYVGSRNNFLTQYVGRRFKSENKSSIVKSTRSDNHQVGVDVKPLGEKVKETTKTASYLGVILLGVAVTGSLFYAVFNELFSSKSPNNVYDRAVKRCLADTRVEDKLGYPITAYGEETRRGRRQHASHVIYNRNGKQCIRMKFYLKGSFHKGTVHLEMMENNSGSYDYRYLFVQIDDMLRNTIIIEDNREKFEHSSIHDDLGTSFSENPKSF